MDRRVVLLLILPLLRMVPVACAEEVSGPRARMESQQGSLGRWFELWKDSPPATREVSSAMDADMLFAPMRDAARGPVVDVSPSMKRPAFRTSEPLPVRRPPSAIGTAEAAPAVQSDVPSSFSVEPGEVVHSGPPTESVFPGRKTSKTGKKTGARSGSRPVPDSKASGR